MWQYCIIFGVEKPLPMMWTSISKDLEDNFNPYSLRINEMFATWKYSTVFVPKNRKNVFYLVLSLNLFTINIYMISW